MSVFQSKAQKRCGERGHGYVMLTETSAAISGCIYCGAHAGKAKVVGTYSYSTVDMLAHVTVAVCCIAIAAVAVVCCVWLAGAV